MRYSKRREIERKRKIYIKAQKARALAFIDEILAQPSLNKKLGLIQRLRYENSN